MKHAGRESCKGELCAMCARSGKQTPASHKVGEEILDDDPMPDRHNLTNYVCCDHYALIVGPAAPCWPPSLPELMKLPAPEEQFEAGIEAAAKHVEKHSCVSSCCDAQPSSGEARDLAECIRKHFRATRPTLRPAEST